AKEMQTIRRVYPNTKLEEFANHTGIRLGAIRGREKIFNFLDIKKLIQIASSEFEVAAPLQLAQYTVLGENVLYSPGKLDITRTDIFGRFLEQTNSEELVSQYPYVGILGKSTLQIIKGMLQEITDEKWKALNENPSTRLIIQSSLYRIMQHLATAENNMWTFG